MKTFKGRAPNGGSTSRRTSPRPPFKRTFSAKGSSSGTATLFDATCSACHKPCKVPFEPNGRKPVYCRDCFIPKSDTPDRSTRLPFSKNKDTRYSGSAFAPRAAYPRPEARIAATADSTTKQIADLNAKVDQLIRMVEKLSR